ncbi:hypothetical protein [Nonomuraea diastatica]|uniref:hypothetical protein n=1 Tax=Nonomuraea diastatica TaxID=1848329 RepID=UPI00140BE4E9|nr:hypothetical protein [Nonomuraea diastatica]
MGHVPVEALGRFLHGRTASELLREIVHRVGMTSGKTGQMLKYPLLARLGPIRLATP